jgi:hypothetical protein
MVMPKTCSTYGKSLFMIVQGIRVLVLPVCDVAEQFMELTRAEYSNRTGIITERQTLLRQSSRIRELRR